MASMLTMTGLAARVELTPEPTPSLREGVRPVRPESASSGRMILAVCVVILMCWILGVGQGEGPSVVSGGGFPVMSGS